jgi:four helix bundle protein
MWEIVLRWEIIARDTVGKQLVRAADSIGANIAEGFGRGSQRDHVRFLKIARGSLNETMHWMRRAFRRSLITNEQVRQLKPSLEAIGPKLNGYIRFVDRPSQNGEKPGADTGRATVKRRSTINNQRSK